MMTIYRIQVSFSDDVKISGEFGAKNAIEAVRKAISKYRSVRGGELTSVTILSSHGMYE